MDKDNDHKQPIIAICYDFDKTLSPDDMQAQGFIQSVGFDAEEFWKKSNTLAKTNAWRNGRSAYPNAAATD